MIKETEEIHKYISTWSTFLVQTLFFLIVPDWDECQTSYMCFDPLEPISHAGLFEQ